MSEPDLDTIAEELYTAHPDGFAAARDEHVKQVRAAGNKALAAELAKLRRPTLSAWVVNLLWRDQRKTIEELLGVGEGMARAQARGSGQELRDLTGRRREIEASLLRRAETLAEDAKVALTAAMSREVQDTLAAALARPDVADDVRSGRLVKPATYAGFGELIFAMPPTDAPSAPAREATPAKPKPSTPSRKSDPQPKADEEPKPDRAAQREAALQEAAERRVEAERAALERAATSLAKESEAADAERQRHQQLLEQVEQLREKLRALVQAATNAERAATAAGHRRAQAEKTHETALRELQQVEK